ncbi:carboxypeptidase S [Schizopora paradoxa]|uniref:Carboxypeptidase S n=1 Tax=Schizopora paradoxa TaxID=27342 RepID=A0A0H2RIG0_9AGAM|nr:carboxypeptidase S [Schizopora paradoxa]
MEKSGLLPMTTPPPRQTWFSSTTRTRIAFLGLTAVLATVFHLYSRGCDGSFGGTVCTWNEVGKSAKELCPQAKPVVPSKHKELWESIGASYDTSEFKDRAVEWLRDAVRIPTESHSKLKLTKVNTYGLLYEWEGKDSSLKPILLTAHQDVVPVDQETVDEWEYPPYSGHFDGQRIWGRGTIDDKSGLIGLLLSIESLLDMDFEPSRKVVLAFGFDEETSGMNGARALGEYMHSSFGEDSFSMLVDEGAGYFELLGSPFAVPGVGEKGAMDVRVDVTSPGGHSSVPPDHTSIGMLSALLVQIEETPYPISISRDSPAYATLQCEAAHSEEMDPWLRKTIMKSVKSDWALRELRDFIEEDLDLRSLFGTTQAIDIILGGVKANALPEEAWAVVDHRIATQSTVADVKKHDTAVLEHLAEKFNLSYTAFGQKVYTGSGAKYGSLDISDAWGTALEPAPITPMDGEAFKLLSGTIKATYNAQRKFKNSEEIIVAPGIMTGNTDTRHYWNLTKNIFRYSHQNTGSGGAIGNGVHTVNESTDIDAFLEMIRFFTTLILNADESSRI